MIQSVGVFLSASDTQCEGFRTLAHNVGKALAQLGLTLIYGGASVGLMGLLAEGALEQQGKVIGVISSDLPDEIAHTGLTRLHRVATIDERKQKIMTLSDAYLVLPGGIGSLEELFQAITMMKIGSSPKKFCGLVNCNGFFDHLIAFLDVACRHSVIQPQHRALIHSNEDYQLLLEQMQQVAV